MIGERGREVRDLVEHVLGEKGLERSVVVVSTSDESPLMRVRAAFAACPIAEEFRDEVSIVLSNALGGQETANFEFPLFTKNKQRVEVPPGPSARSRTFPTAPEPL